mmetsp:Transcript_25112/g.60842  ORF Transcript_25112/g.60842 Transcript_25112/m.60842 type:complete len:219 (-) Transcript_25112:4582-5238(-)
MTSISLNDRTVHAPATSLSTLSLACLSPSIRPSNMNDCFSRLNLRASSARLVSTLSFSIPYCPLSTWIPTPRMSRTTTSDVGSSSPAASMRQSLACLSRSVASSYRPNTLASRHSPSASTACEVHVPSQPPSHLPSLAVRKRFSLSGNSPSANLTCARNDWHSAIPGCGLVRPGVALSSASYTSIRRLSPTSAFSRRPNSRSTLASSSMRRARTGYMP